MKNEAIQRPQSKAAEIAGEALLSSGRSIGLARNKQWGAFAETDLERDLDIIQLNISSLQALTKPVLPHMLARNEGKILQVGTEAGTAPIPLLTVYAATKAFVLSFSAALANELKDPDITVTVLLPGATDTDFFHKAEQEGTVGYREDRLASPKDVAKDGYDALMRGENKIIFGAKTKMHVWMNDLLGAKKAPVQTGKKWNVSHDKVHSLTIIAAT